MEAKQTDFPHLSEVPRDDKDGQPPAAPATPPAEIPKEPDTSAALEQNQAELASVEASNKIVKARDVAYTPDTPRPEPKNPHPDYMPDAAHTPESLNIVQRALKAMTGFGKPRPSAGTKIKPH